MPLFPFWRKIYRKDKVRQYLDAGRIPWSEGYKEYRYGYLTGILRDTELLQRFSRSETLPAGHGVGLDERVVEYPWLLGRLRNSTGLLLDAGSVLNYPFLLEHPGLQGRPMVLMTLAPESYMAKSARVSYVFGDLRKTFFQDNTFTDIVCVSTLEHVGQDNTRLYTEDRRYRENQPEDSSAAVAEFRRILAPGGRLNLTVPFGKPQNCGWLQQFDSARLRKVADAFGAPAIQADFFRYGPNGWQRSDESACADCEYYDVHSSPAPAPDLAAAARAVACLEFVKPT